MVLTIYFNQAQLYVMHSRQGMWCGLCCLGTGTSKVQGKRQSLPRLIGRRRTQWAPVNTHWYVCHISSWAWANTKGDWIVLTFQVPHPSWLGCSQKQTTPNFLLREQCSEGEWWALLYEMIPGPQTPLSSHSTIFPLLDPLHLDSWQGIRQRKRHPAWPSQPGWWHF